jgi:hypothetical protein
MLLKVASEARIEPPIHVVYSRSGGAEMRILVSFGDNGCRRTSLNNRSPNPDHRGEIDRQVERQSVRLKIMSDSAETLVYFFLYYKSMNSDAVSI